MDAAALDVFFAKAEDVLTDWEPSSDAMVARAPEGDSDDLAPAGDSYYDQALGRGWFQEWSDQILLDYVRRPSVIEGLWRRVAAPSITTFDELAGWTTLGYVTEGAADFANYRQQFVLSFPQPTVPAITLGIIGDLEALAAHFKQEDEPARPEVLPDVDNRVIAATLGTSEAAREWVRVAAGEIGERPSPIAELRERRPELFHAPTNRRLREMTRWTA